MVSLKQIRYFLTVADLGGFTPAAASLFVAQPALSRQIALLEEELGFALFERNPRGVTLTTAGELYRERVRGIEQQLAFAADEAAQLARGNAGVLRLLHSSSIPLGSLLPVIRQFLELAPGARVDLDRLSSEIQVGEIAKGRADVGIIRLPVLRRDPAVEFIELPNERLWVALPAEHRLADTDQIALADLAEELFVSAVHRERGGLARRVTDLCLARGFLPRLARVISRKTSMLDLVAAGLGIAVVPERMTILGNPNLRFRPLSDGDADAGIAIIQPRQPTPLAARFTALLHAECLPGAG
jgi:DNA-binding transcriptional LysR family regulator